jgi:geranylgeranyl diphosphate synthase type II
MTVAASCGTLDPDDAYAAAVSLELLHAASLVHDDLPCFDDADMRRGRPSTHRAFGEPLAVLAGDALIVLAFESLAVGATPRRVPALTSALARAAGLPSGLVAGQALESEASASVVEYHRAKTASLFSAAAQMGALVAGEDPAAWAKVGELVGRAYQAIDDIRDAVSCADEIGKPVGRDRALGRPSVVQTSGVVSARAWTRDLLDAARVAVPTCERPELVCRFIDELAGALTS